MLYGTMKLEGIIEHVVEYISFFHSKINHQLEFTFQIFAVNISPFCTWSFWELLSFHQNGNSFLFGLAIMRPIFLGMSFQTRILLSVCLLSYPFHPSEGAYRVDIVESIWSETLGTHNRSEAQTQFYSVKIYYGQQFIEIR